jgi:hypothetical protein
MECFLLVVSEFTIPIEIVSLIVFRCLIGDAIEVENPHGIIQIDQASDMVIIRMRGNETDNVFPRRLGLDLFDDVVFVFLRHAAVNHREVVGTMFDVKHVSITN